MVFLVMFTHEIGISPSTARENSWQSLHKFYLSMGDIPKLVRDFPNKPIFNSHYTPLVVVVAALTQFCRANWFFSLLHDTPPLATGIFHSNTAMDSKVVDLADDAGEDKDAEPDKVESTAKKPRVDASPAFVPAAATDTPGALHEPGVVPIGYQLALPMVTITACDEGKVSPSNRIEGEVAIGPGGSLWRMRVFPSGCSTSPPSCIGVFVAPKEVCDAGICVQWPCNCVAVLHSSACACRDCRLWPNC